MLVELDFFAEAQRITEGENSPATTALSKQRSEGQVAVANDLHSMVQ